MHIYTHTQTRTIGRHAGAARAGSEATASPSSIKNINAHNAGAVRM